MLNYTQTAHNATQFLALTGYTQAEFQGLLPYFETKFTAHMATQTLAGTPRRARTYSAYANSPLPTIEDKLFFILTYLKTANLQVVQGALFGMTQPVANQWIHRLLPIVNQALAAADVLPARTMAEVAFDPEREQLYFHDGTERPINRPSDPADQTANYSGKKKQHTVKNNVIIDNDCRIIFLTDTVEGKKHDKKLADETGYTLPAGSILVQDTGFQGFTLDDVLILQPKKKPRGKTLSALSKAINQWISRLRIRIEHAIGGVKRYRIVKDKLRIWKKGIRDLIFETCCGLHNFRLNFRPWHYETVLPLSSLMLKS
ncbi:MAG: transposase family protein [bacterium]